MPRMVVLANGASGEADDEEERLEAIREAFRAAGTEAEVRCVPGKQLQAAALHAVSEGTDVLVAAGGDGTVSTVANAVAGTRTALAVLPLGTLNHFAKDVGLPLGLDEAAKVAVHGVPRAVDVGEVNGRVYVNNVSIGLYPAAVQERERIMESEGASKARAMLRAAGTALGKARRHRFFLAVDGRPAVRVTSFVMVGNNVYETGLGRLGKRADLTGGRLSVYTLKRPGRRHVLGLAARALVGRVEEAPHFDAREAKEVVIDCRRGHVWAGIDGEVAPLSTPLRFSACPRALLLMQEA